MKLFNETLTRLGVFGLFLGLFMHLPAMNNQFLDLTDAEPTVVAFFQLCFLALGVAVLIGGEN